MLQFIEELDKILTRHEERKRGDIHFSETGLKLLIQIDVENLKKEYEVLHNIMERKNELENWGVEDA